MFCNLGASTQSSWIRPIMSYLWMIGLEMRLFSCGANLWKLSASIQPKKGPTPWILFLTPAPQPLEVTFLVGKAEHVWLHPFCKDKYIFSQKTCVLYFGRAVDTKFLNLSHFVLSMNDRSGDGANLWKSSTRIRPNKGPAPWILFLTPAPPPLEMTFFGSWNWIYLNIPFYKDKCIFFKKHEICNLGALTQNSWIRPIMSYFWMIGLVMRFFSCGANLWRLSASIQPKKGPTPWILFLTPCASASWSHFFGW